MDDGVFVTIDTSAGETSLGDHEAQLLSDRAQRRELASSERIGRAAASQRQRADSKAWDDDGFDPDGKAPGKDIVPPIVVRTLREPRIPTCPCGTLSIVATLPSVLVIDDDPDIRRIVWFALVNIGHFHVRLASGAEEALSHVREARPDVVLLDVSMPSTDGPQTLELLRGIASMKDVPIAFLTAAVGQSQPDTPRARESVDALRRSGAADIIAKPFDLEDLCERVRRLLPRSGVV